MRILPIIFLKSKLKTLLDILNLALEISHDVALLLRGDLLHVLLHIIALLLGVIIALVPKLNLTDWASCTMPQSCSWVLEHFFLYPVLYSFSSLVVHYSWWYTAAVHVESDNSFHSLALLFWNDGCFRHLYIFFTLVYIAYDTTVLAVHFLSVHLLFVHLLAVYLLSVHLIAVRFFSVHLFWYIFFSCIFSFCTSSCGTFSFCTFLPCKFSCCTLSLCLHIKTLCCCSKCRFCLTASNSLSIPMFGFGSNLDLNLC